MFILCVITIVFISCLRYNGNYNDNDNDNNNNNDNDNNNDNEIVSIIYIDINTSGKADPWKVSKDLRARRPPSRVLYDNTGVCFLLLTTKKTTVIKTRKTKT